MYQPRLIHKLPPNEVIVGVVNSKNEPVRVVPFEDYQRYHVEDSFPDGRFCYLGEDYVASSAHYPDEELKVLTEEGLRYVNLRRILW